ncbi:MAG: pentapeptide repeat-containing protein [Geitlerinemataceae cyanobacterium]
MKLGMLATVTLIGTTSLTAPVIAENLEHMRQLLSTKSCPGCDLSSAGLVFSNLAGANLSGANLVRANLSQSDLTGADLSNANLVGASLSSANLAGANLAGANLASADLRGAYLMGANLEDADLSNANLQGAVGIPVYAVAKEDLLAWGNEEAGRGNFENAISYYNEALSLDPEYAQAYLSRSVARNRMSDKTGALADAQLASELYFVEGDEPGYDAAMLFTAALEAEIEAAARGPRKPGFFDTLGNIGVMLLQFGLF